MLKMFFGEMEEAYYSGSELFDNWVDCGVINTDFSKRVIKEIDGSEVVSPYLIMSPVLGAISYRMLSGGAKTLMCLVYTDTIFDLAAMGDNCFKFLPEIAYIKDITLCTAMLRIPPVEEFHEGIYIINDGSIVRTKKEFANKFVEIKGEEGW